MRSSIPETPEIKSAYLVSVGADILSPQLIRQVLDEQKACEKRQRDLPMVLVVWLCIVMSWSPRSSIEAVLKRLLEVSSLFAPLSEVRLPSRSAISQARYRLGVKPLHALFHRLCRPSATPDMTWAYRFGLRLVSLDGTVENLTDTTANQSYFGRASGRHGDAAFPSCRAAYLCECGTHIIFDASIGSYHTPETQLARRLLRSITADMLVCLDSGLVSFDMVQAVFTRGSQVLAAARPASRLRPCQSLPDGTYLSWLHPTDKSLNRRVEPVLVRVILYRIQDPHSPHHGKQRRLLTTLLDPVAFPVRDLIMIYHERWEVELVIDELDTHQRLPHHPFRSQKPVGVLQEFYALLLAHFIVRWVMLQTAQEHLLDPDRLSFCFALQCVRDAIPYFQLFPHHTTFLWRWVHHWIAQVIVPQRRLRWNPRVVKRRQDKFPRKQAQHFHPPKPSCSFRDSICLT